MADGFFHNPLWAKSPILSPTELIAMSWRQSIFEPHAQTSWLRHNSSAQAIQQFAAEHFGDKKRDYGEVLELTHFAESAIGMFNLVTPDLDGTDPEENAYILYAHDLMEALSKYKLTEEWIVRDTWRGNSSRIPYLLDRLREFTDSPGLNKIKKLQEQVIRARASESSVYAYGRFAEKRATFRRDLWCFNAGAKKFDNQELADHYIQNKLLPREWVVDNLPIDEKYKQEFRQLSRSIQHAIGRQLNPDIPTRFARAALKFVRPEPAVRPGAPTLIQALRQHSLPSLI